MEPNTLGWEKSLRRAVTSGDVHEFRTLACPPRSDVNRVVECVATAGNPDMMRFIVSHPGFDAACESAAHALYIACKNNWHLCAFELLRSESVPRNYTDRKGFTPLGRAIVCNATQCVLLLIADRLVDIENVGPHGAKALMVATQYPCPGAMIAIHRSGRADVNARDEFGMTALMHACKLGNKDAVCCLVANRSVDTRVALADGRTAKDLAIECGHAKCVAHMHHIDMIEQCR